MANENTSTIRFVRAPAYVDLLRAYQIFINGEECGIACT